MSKTAGDETRSPPCYPASALTKLEARRPLRHQPATSNLSASGKPSTHSLPTPNNYINTSNPLFHTQTHLLPPTSSLLKDALQRYRYRDSERNVSTADHTLDTVASRQSEPCLTLSSSYLTHLFPSVILRFAILPYLTNTAVHPAMSSVTSLTFAHAKVLPQARRVQETLAPEPTRSDRPSTERLMQGSWTMRGRER